MQKTQNKILLVQIHNIEYLANSIFVAQNFYLESNSKIDLFCNKSDYERLPLLNIDTFDNIYFLEDFFSPNKNLSDNCSLFNNLIQTLDKNSYSTIINLSFNKASAYVAGALSTKRKIGYFYNEHAELSIEDTWSQYYYACIESKGLINTINTIDLFSNIFNIKDRINFHSEISSDQNLITLTPDSKDNFGATKWGELIYQISKSNKNIKFQVIAENESLLNQISNLPILANEKSRVEFIKSKNLKISKIPCLVIGQSNYLTKLFAIFSIQTIQLIGDTNPYTDSVYSNNSILIKSNGSISQISIHLLKNLSLKMMSSTAINPEDLLEELPTFHVENVNIYKTFLDQVNGLKLNPLFEYQSNTISVLRDFHNLMWNLVLKNNDTNLKFPILNKPTAAELTRYMEGVSNLFELSQYAIKSANQLLNNAESDTPSSKTIKECADRLIEIDNLYLVSRKPFPLLSNLIDFLYVQKANIKAENIIDVAQHSLILYHQAANYYSVLFELLQQSIAKFNPNLKDKEVND